jgi:hypothetical protein
LLRSKQFGGQFGAQPGGHVGSSQQSAAFVAACPLDVEQQPGEQLDERSVGQSVGQLGSSQQIAAFALYALARPIPAQTLPAVSVSNATATSSERFVIGQDLHLKPSTTRLRAKGIVPQARTVSNRKTLVLFVQAFETARIQLTETGYAATGAGELFFAKLANRFFTAHLAPNKFPTVFSSSSTTTCR